MMRKCWTVWFLVLLMSLPVPAESDREGATRSGEQNSPDLKQLEDEARRIQQEIDESEARLNEFKTREASVISILNDLDFNIDKVRRRITANRRKLTAIEKQTAAATNTYKRLTDDIEANEAYVANRLVALYRLRWFDRMQFLASAESVSDMLQRQRGLERILGHDRRIRQKLFEDQTQLQSVIDDLHTQQAQRQRLQAAIRKELNGLSVQHRRRSDLLSRIRDQRTLEKEMLESLRRAATELDETIQSLDSRPPDAIFDDTTMRFSELKGLLRMPVGGKIIRKFGHYTDSQFNLTHFRSGVDIRARKGAKIEAVYAGRIIYANWFKGYGNMIIIDHGDSYYTVYAHLQDMYVKTGDRVNTGNDIATVGDTGSIIGPILYFEVRHHGKPMDPLKWLMKG